ncbi:MAG: Nif3-like dinuclear metal center hexameric protein [Acidobacteria bacterium]|nr:Nif3-like dinuclear metal center hexameric protein [Acidobacteriota bacterium]
MSRERLVAFLDEYLDAHEGSDYCPNGLQVQGRAQVGHVVTGVSACRDLFQRATERGAHAVLVHHGLFWRGDEQPLVGLLYRRVRLLLEAGINLLAYHLPLDRHPELGNNALAARRFGIDSPRPFGDNDGLPIGFGGRLPTPLSAVDLAARCQEVFGQVPLAFEGGPEAIASVAFVSGAAERALHTAIAEGYDAFVTGETSEWVMNVARESGIHFFAAGHYATERLGIEALGRHVASELGVSVEFVDVPNPV